MEISESGSLGHTSNAVNRGWHLKVIAAAFYIARHHVEVHNCVSKRAESPNNVITDTVKGEMVNI